METTTRRRAGRPRAFDREAALNTAMDLFWRQGYEGTSTSQLTEAIGITPSSLYAAFGSKDALYFESLKLYQAQHGEYFAQALESHALAKDAMQAVLEGAARQFTDLGHAPGCMIATANVQCADLNREIANSVSQLRQNALVALKVRLDKALVDGELPANTLTLPLATYFALVIQGMAVQAHDGATLATLFDTATLAMACWPAAVPD